MSLVRATLFALLTASAAGVTLAQTRLQPGLWEHETTMKGGGAQMDAAMARMQERLAAMPPDKRAQMEAMLAQQGISLPGAGGGGMKIKVCLTPEQAARDEVPQQTQDGQCKQTSRSRSGNTLKMSFECTGPRQARGEGEFTLLSPKEHTGKMTMTMTRGEQTGTMEMQSRGRWLAADCGDVKPRP